MRQRVHNTLFSFSDLYHETLANVRVQGYLEQIRLQAAKLIPAEFAGKAHV